MSTLRRSGLPTRRKMSVSNSAKETKRIVAEKLGISPNYRKPGVVLTLGPKLHPSLRCFVNRPPRAHPIRTIAVGGVRLTMQYTGILYLLTRRDQGRGYTKTFHSPKEMQEFITLGRIKALLERPPLMLPAPSPETLAEIAAQKARHDAHMKRFAHVAGKVFASKKTIPAFRSPILLAGPKPVLMLPAPQQAPARPEHFNALSVKAKRAIRESEAPRPNLATRIWRNGEELEFVRWEPDGLVYRSAIIPGMPKHEHKMSRLQLCHILKNNGLRIEGFRPDWAKQVEPAPIGA